MDIEGSPGLVERLAIVDRSRVSDASPGEVARELDLTSNLLAHHLKLLEQAGLIQRSRSEGDHRRPTTGWHPPSTPLEATND